MSLKIVICRCTQKWNVSSEQAIASSADRNKNTPVKLNNAHHGNSSACKFSTFVANLNLLMHKLALAAVTKMLEAGGLSGAF